MKKLIASTSFLLISFLLQGSSAQAVTCNVAFDVNMNWFADQARNTYANPTMFKDGRYQHCPEPLPNTDTGTCWMYKQFCTAGKAMTAFNQIAPYYHMMFDDPTITCINSVGFGRKNSVGGCISADWGREPRTLLTVYGRDSWIEIAQKKEGNYMPFKLISLNLGNSHAIQLWYKRPDGQVFGWSDLPGNTNWEINAEATIVWVGSVSRQGGFMIKDFVAETY